MLNPLTPSHRTPRYYGLAVRYLSRGLEGPRGTLVDAVPMPMTPAGAAAHALAGLPTVIASSPDEARELCRELAERAAAELREKWAGMGVSVDVVTERQGALFGPSYSTRENLTAGEPAGTP